MGVENAYDVTGPPIAIGGLSRVRSDVYYEPMARGKRSSANGTWKWFHVTFATYGSWLPGDPRGFRTKKHRYHVDGDYKSPPPGGKYDELHARNRTRLRRPPVTLSHAQRQVAGAALLEMLRTQAATVVVVGVGGQHVHVVAKLPADAAKLMIGRAKKHAWFVLRAKGHVGRAWAAGCRALPVRDRAHQLEAIKYVKKHRAKGAWVWTWGEAEPLAERSKKEK